MPRVIVTVKKLIFRPANPPQTNGEPTKSKPGNNRGQLAGHTYYLFPQKIQVPVNTPGAQKKLDETRMPANKQAEAQLGKSLRK